MIKLYHTTLKEPPSDTKNIEIFDIDDSTLLSGLDPFNVWLHLIEETGNHTIKSVTN